MFRGLVMEIKQTATIGAMILTLASCSSGAAIETLAGEDGKNTAFTLGNQLCGDNSAAFQERLDPEIRTKSVELLKQVKSYCPESPGRKQLVSYSTHFNKSTGESSSRREIVVVEQSGGKWIRYEFALRSLNGGPELISHWNIDATKEKPADLATLDAFDRAVPTLRLIGIGLLLAIAGIVAWLVVLARRRKAKSQGG